MDEASPETQFPTPFVFPCSDALFDMHDHVEEPVALAELRMQGLSWAIRSKKGWQDKIKNPEIVARWRKEAEVQAEGRHPEEKMGPNMINYVLTELEAYARITDPETGIQHACNDVTFCSHDLISEDLLRLLRQGVSILENIPDNKKDWHPGSKGQVLDLVHPSLHCLVYGQTLVRSEDGSYEPAEVPSGEAISRLLQFDYNNHYKSLLSDRFAWIPSDFSVSKDGKVDLLSPYINNLHSSNEVLYTVVPKILERFVPMFERVLGGVYRFNPNPWGRPEQQVKPRARVLPGRIIMENCEVPCVWGNYEEPDSGDLWQTQFEGYPGETRRERRLNWYRTHPLVLPDSPEEYKGSLEENFWVTDLKGRTLQCIVKLANIHLTPNQPEYLGGSWHIEGMLNERIVATGIYYYDSENTTDSHLQFRTRVDEPEAHLQDDDFCMRALYGIGRDDPLQQDRGSIKTVPGLALAFPNIYQHRVSPFQLSDPSRPGHRKILAFFLIDPNNRIPSASDVVPQQQYWKAELMQDLSQNGIGGTRLALLPMELRTMIVEKIEGTMTWEEACDYRMELIEERSRVVTDQNNRLASDTFNLCEH